MGMFGRMFSGMAYGIGFGIGLTLWNILRRLIKVAVVAGAVAYAAHGQNLSFFGIDAGRVLEFFRHFGGGF